MTIKIAICDDELPFINNLKSLLASYDWQHIEISVASFSSGEELLKTVNSGTNYDIIFLDIELSEKFMGYDIGTKLKSYIPDTLLFYVSSYTKYTMNIITAEPFYFIHKPIFSAELYRALDRCVHRIRYLKKDYIYTYVSGNNKYNLHLYNIKYFMSERRIINAHSTNNTIQFYGKLDIVQKEIEDICNFFLRANKSCLVNANYITNATRTKVDLDDIEISVTDTYKHDFFIRYAKFLT